MTAVLKPLPPREAIAALRRRRQTLAPTFAWQDVYAAEHAAMFTVAKSAGYDILTDILAGLETALKDGGTLRDFTRDLTPILQQKGWWGRKAVVDPETGEPVLAQLGSPRRLQTIFDVNMRVSYAAGHWSQFQRTKAARPYLRYVAILDERTRPEHAARHNLCLPVDHPYWKTWAPPCGWNCRCTLQSLSERDVERMRSQLKFTPPPDEYREWTNKRTGEVRSVPVGIDPGWDYNPGEAGHLATLQKLEAKYDRRGQGLLFGELPKEWPKGPETPEAAEELASEIDRAQREWTDSLDEDKLDAIAFYKAEGHRLANRLLRDGWYGLNGEEDDAEIEAAKEMTADLHRALKTAAFPRTVTTFRGVDADTAEQFAKLEPGDLFLDKGFYSSSLYEPIAQAFGDFVVETRVPKGAHAVALVHYIPDVNHVEYEVLLDAGYRFRVIEKTEDRLVLEVITGREDEA
ncbi:SPP1 gp7 family putative phage head morphogenesis protein [Breoghania corrubedonensis]|uniref:SPP1 gp7 family putative phage head morphogenesis protein n=1 Tax=Breoghania corrubedonensis TaxID=665038 RepID=A0A2T5VCD0_9HYPH|nr:phage minor head protein [Breoghania corrubedonensis]PTW61419.1 SPP1 gp7 family putative phage head morphogenesis protein [Breoghania corrubedonensis]